MRTLPQDKYTLRDIHREIDLFDRKLIHLVKHEVFPTETLRDAAVRKATTKREQLANQARSLAALGIEFQPSDLPRSFRSGEPVETASEVAAAAEAASVSAETASDEAAFQKTSAPTTFGEQVAMLQKQTDSASPLAAWQSDLAAYKKRRQKLPVEIS
jgi:hypothetical protein